MLKAHLCFREGKIAGWIQKCVFAVVFVGPHNSTVLIFPLQVMFPICAYNVEPKDSREAVPKYRHGVQEGQD